MESFAPLTSRTPISKMNFGDHQQALMNNNNGSDARRELRDREMALALMNQRLANSQSHQNQLQRGQQQVSLMQQGGPSSTLFDLYTSQANRQDASTSFLSSSLFQPSSGAGGNGGGGNNGGGVSIGGNVGNNNGAFGALGMGASVEGSGGGVDQTHQLFYSDALNRMMPPTSNARRGSASSTGAVGAPDSFFGMQLFDSSSPALSSLYGGFGAGGGLSLVSLPNATNNNSAGIGGNGGGGGGGAGSNATGVNMATNNSSFDSLTASMLRDNALMRERLLGRTGDQQLQLGPSLPYRSLLAGPGAGIGSNHSFSDRLVGTSSSQMPSASESIMLARNQFMGDGLPQQQPSLLSSGGGGGNNFGGLGSLVGSSSQSTSSVGAVEAGKFPANLPVVLAVPEDNQKLSSHQVLLRNQIEAFQAAEDDLTTHTRGRNKPIKLGQVGIRCRHCARLPVARRQKGSTYFPASLHGLYQAAQNMNTTHMQSGLCTEMPPEYKQMFAEAMNNKVSSSVAGRPYWAKTAKQLGLIDTEDGIRFIRDLTPNQIAQIRAAQQQQSQSHLPPGRGPLPGGGSSSSNSMGVLGPPGGRF